jgi:hypothetical protein
VQVDLIKPKLKPPGTKHLKWNVMNCFQTLLSNTIYAATPRGAAAAEMAGAGGELAARVGAMSLAAAAGGAAAATGGTG